METVEVLSETDIVKNPKFSVISVSAETDRSEASVQFYHLPNYKANGKLFLNLR